MYKYSQNCSDFGNTFPKRMDCIGGLFLLEIDFCHATICMQFCLKKSVKVVYGLNL